MASDPYVRAAQALMALARTLVEARAVRYDAPDRERIDHPQPSNREGISDPTFAVVADEQRWALSSRVGEIEHFLRSFAADAESYDVALTADLSRFNNEIHMVETPVSSGNC